MSNMRDDLIRILSDLSHEDLRLVYVVALELNKEGGATK